LPSTATNISAIRIAGKRKLHIDDTHDDRFRPAANVGCQEANGRTDDQGEEAGENADRERNPQTVEDRREQVATRAIGAKPERHARHRLLAGRQSRIQHVDLAEIVGVLRRNEGREQRKGDDCSEHDQCGRGNLALEIFRDEALERCLNSGLARQLVGFRFVGGETRIVLSGNGTHGVFPPSRTLGSRIE
jgi:hypothetical protein